ncbi:AAA family ATPase [Kitasatospora mediocidica]|uniref:AAA family ATPase n=1 Tax=Kitasatospora mediocidica TaxID=58352 RepID=UPI000567721B|nr:ATP-binding protein [Kitasatospora mediocidica]
MLYDTVKVALEQLTDDRVFERVAYRVMRHRYPDLRITTATSDTGLDGYSRPLFGPEEEIVLWASFENTKAKLKPELAKHKDHGRRANAIFVTNKSTPTEATQRRWKRDALKDWEVHLEIFTLDQLVEDLETDDLRWVAEADLGVRPKQPRHLLTCAEYLDRLAIVPGMSEPLLGRDDELQSLRHALRPEDGTARVVVVEGPGGIGKTRLAMEAAHTTSTTLVIPTGVAAPSAVFAAVPLNVSLIVIVDDAHRSPDLSGLAALINDRRFDRVRLLLTVRPGYRDLTLQRAGLELHAAPPFEVEALDRPFIDGIMTARGITHSVFRQSVVDLAQGNPMLAHAACEVALSRGVFVWDDAASLLRDLMTRRLGDRDTDAHRAAAVALALLGSAADADQLAPIADAVRPLPPQRHEIATLLDDLADAGLADAPPYSLRPAVVGQVLLADALDPAARVRLDTAKALALLGVGHEDRTHAGNEASGALIETAAALGPTLGALALAARERGNRVVSAQLATVVTELLPGVADMRDAALVAAVATEVIPAAPGLLADMHSSLVERWPLPASTDVWGRDPVGHYRSEVVHLGQRFGELAERAGLDAMPNPVSVLLDMAWLAEPALPSDGHDLKELLRPISRWCSAPAHTLPGSFAALLQRRREVLRSIAQWHRDRTAQPPPGLGPAEATVREPQSRARVLLAALQPLLQVTVESTHLGSPHAANVAILHAHILPDQPDTTTLLTDAVDLLAPLLDEPSIRTPGNRHLLYDLMELPSQLRGEGARPVLGSGQPMPAHAIAALDTAAEHAAQATADRWGSLPLAARRRAAQASLRFEEPRTLTAAAALGDPVAAAAMADPALARLLIVQPVDTSAPWREGIEAQRQAAEDLAEQISTEEVIALLEQIDQSARGYAASALPGFAVAAGAAAPSPDAVLERLAQGPLAGEISLLTGLAKAHETAVWTWIDARLADPRLATLALWIGDQHPDHEPELFANIVACLTTNPAPNGTGHAQLIAAFARHLITCGQPAQDRLQILAKLGTCGPADALPNVLEGVGMLLADARAAGLALDDALLDHLANLLRRRLDDHSLTSRASIHSDSSVASAAVEIAVSAPSAFATILAERLLTSGGDHSVPIAWEDRLRDLDHGARENLAVAFHEAVEQLRTAQVSVLTEHQEAAVAQTLTLLGEGTGYWRNLLERWAAGAPDDRVRAAVAIQSAWQDPSWALIVSAVLSAGVTAATRENLLHGLLYTDLHPGLPAATQARQAALAPLHTDKTSAVRRFATEAQQRLDEQLESYQAGEIRDVRGYR